MQLLLILDFNYSGKWVKTLIEEDNNTISIQASCKPSQKSNTGEFGSFFTYNLLKYFNKHSIQSSCLPQKQEI